MLWRRMLMFAGVLFAITALAAAFAPQPRQTSTGGPATTAPAPSSLRGKSVSRKLDAGASRPAHITVGQGDLLHLEVTGDMLDSVEIEGLAAVGALGPGAVATFDILTDEAGTYPVVLTGSDRRVGTIDVTPPPRQGLAPAAPLTHRTRDT